jgi:hypothetical protein
MKLRVPERLLALMLASVAVASCTKPSAQPASNLVIVSKTPTCGCCEKWVAHMRDAGFTVEVRNMSDTSGEREKAGVPPELSSCHTALVGGYAIEGHVPADLVHKLLKERPKITGLAVGGMPVGSPGMEQPGFEEPYEVTAFDRSGKRSVYARR